MLFPSSYLFIETIIVAYNEEICFEKKIKFNKKILKLIIGKSYYIQKHHPEHF